MESRSWNCLKSTNFNNILGSLEIQTGEIQSAELRGGAAHVSDLDVTFDRPKRKREKVAVGRLKKQI